MQWPKTVNARWLVYEFLSELGQRPGSNFLGLCEKTQTLEEIIREKQLTKAPEIKADKNFAEILKRKKVGMLLQD